MSKIDELLKDEKVEWKKLGEVSQILKGKQFNKRDMLEDGIYPVINGGILPSGYINLFNRNENTITVSQGGASAGYVNFIEEKFWLGAHAFSVIPDNEIITEYAYDYSCFNRLLFHILKMNQMNLQDSKEGAGIPSVSKDKLSIIEVPLTSKQVQKEIVKTLDKFTNYVTELQSELQSRTKQYEYYRDMLLSEEYLNIISEKIYGIENKNEITYCRIKDVCNRQKGINITAEKMKELNSDNAPVKIFAGGSTTAHLDVDVVGKKNVIEIPSVIVKSRGNIDFEYYDKPFSHKNEMWSYSTINDEVLNIKFLFYLLKNNLKYFKDNSISGKLPQISTGVTDNYKIPIIPIVIQNKVVEILDKFQSLLADTKGLLPQEIEQRQKQYEYYREKLLTFDENSVKRERERERAYLSNSYLNSLKEAGKIVGVSVFGVELKKLEDFAEIYDGTHQTPKYVNTGVPFISVQDIKNIYGTNKYITMEEYNKFKVKPRKNDVFMTRIGDIGTCAIVKNDDDLAYYVTLALIRPSNDIVLSKFLKYLIESNQGKKELSKRILHNATPIKINLGEIGKLKFFIPSIPVQEHIVSILDKFDNIVNDISKGLPKEIELRQKQYEHYREKLLSFKRNN